MEDLSRETIIGYYSELENRSELSLMLSFFANTRNVGIFDSNKEGKDIENSQKLNIIKRYVKQNEEQIKRLLKNNSRKVDFIVEAVTIIAPAIAQQYSGITALSIVAALIIMTRQGIERFLQ